MPIIINPEKLSSEDIKLLFCFFASQAMRQIQYWKAGEVIRFGAACFYFEHNVVARQRGKDKPGLRYEFLCKEILGDGGCGTVHKVAGTLILKDDLSYEYKKDKRVVKVQSLKASRDIPDPIAFVEREFHMTRQLPYMRVKSPTFTKDFSYTVTHLFKGTEFLDVILRDIESPPSSKLSFEKRYKLSCAALQALKLSSEKGIIHGDVKAENMIMENDDLIHLIDFGASWNLGKPNHCTGGSLDYVPPEMAIPSTPKTINYDVYSMARVLMVLWGSTVYSFNSTNITEWQFKLKLVDKDIANLFESLIDVTESNKTIIRSTLLGMLNRNPANRLSLDEAIAAFNTVQLNSSTQSAHAFFKEASPLFAPNAAKQPPFRSMSAPI